MNEKIIFAYSAVMVCLILFSYKDLENLLFNKLFIVSNIVLVIGLACAQEEVIAVIIIIFFLGLLFFHRLFNKERVVACELKNKIYDKIDTTPATIVEETIKIQEVVNNVIEKAAEQHKGIDMSKVTTNITEDSSLYSDLVSNYDKAIQQKKDRLISEAMDSTFRTDPSSRYFTDSFSGVKVTPNNVLDFAKTYSKIDIRSLM